MKVYVEGKLFDSNLTGIMLMFDAPSEQKWIVNLLADMVDENHKFCIYPESWSEGQATAFMNEVSVNTEKQGQGN